MPSSAPPGPRPRIPRSVLAWATFLLFAVAAVAAIGVGNPLHEMRVQRGRTALAVLCTVAGLICASALLIRPSLARPKRVACFSLAFSLLCALGTLFTWIAVGTGHTLEDVPGTPVSTKEQVRAELTAKGREGLQPIPTGVLVETMEFTNSHNVRLTGYVWQTLPADAADTEHPHLDLPDAVDGGVTTTRTYRAKRDDQQVVGWQLRATLRQSFDYGNFPLDKQTVGLTMRPRSARVVLVPDFYAYPSWQPGKKYGLYQDLVSGEWHTEYTTYSLDMAHEATNYGRPAVSIGGGVPELSFVVGVSRPFLSPLLHYLVPLLVIAFLVFGSLFVITVDPDRRTVSGFSTWAVISFCGSMLLVVSVQLSSLYDATGSSGIVYAEYFYFIQYVVISLVCLDVIEHTSPRLNRIIDWRGNAVARLLYWPVYSTLLLLATVGVLLL
ncbi:hypothetical protein OG897_29940 [Streptomyces sp. NBC_00237]|uniref:hypothetical protein n=1 Tax=Streptomyces sp. NBC_00237 TaxID=2975687 RepID=UPI00225493B0|nr:hypothetical protein [Streptomyces sp. NBC_00237]MCX5205663.1 hypothetical protein [Streptomyces sp. NBC_00237]